MAKIGTEVEGRLRGVLTLFVDAEEVLSSPSALINHAKNYGITHIYISDRINVLDYEAVGSLLPQPYLVTLDVTVVSSKPRPTNMTLILTLPHAYWRSVECLRPDDQIKFHSVDRNVLMTTARTLVPTSPIEFCGDQEL